VPFRILPTIDDSHDAMRQNRNAGW